MKSKRFLKSRRGKLATIVLSAIILFALFLHINVNAHASHLQQDMHPEHHSTSVCATNFCCFQVCQDDFFFDPEITSFKIFNLPLCASLTKNIELPYKPPKI